MSIDIEKLNQELVILVEKRIELSQLSYDDKRYDEVEERMHEIEDDFLGKYDDYLEDVLLNIHDEYCPETEVLSPLAYVAKKYLKTEKNTYEVADDNQGVWVEIDEIPEKEAHIAFVPNPVRAVLSAGGFKKIVWSS